MKKLLFGLIATIMFGFVGNAQEKTTFKSASITTKANKEVVSYKYTTLKDFDEQSDKIVEQTVANAQRALADACTVTIEMSVTVTIEASVGVAGGSTSVTVTGSITTSCDGAVAAGKKLRAQLIAMAGG